MGELAGTERRLGRSLPPRALLVALVLAAASPAPSLAQVGEPPLDDYVPDPRFLLRARFGGAFGGSPYGLSFPASTIPAITGNSQLDWPMNGLLVGIDLGVGGDVGRDRRWDLILSVSGTVTNPAGTLLDRDWLASAFEKLEFSHTDSSVRGQVLLSDLMFRFGRRWHFSSEPSGGVDGTLGLRHEFFQQTGYGFSGWQLDGNLSQVAVSYDPSTAVVRRTTHRFLPYVGLGALGGLGRWRFEVDGGLMLAVGLDEDDHLLRHKLATASSVGAGFFLRARSTIRLTPRSGRGQVALGIQLDYRALTGSGSLGQRYYADDPGIDGDQTGQVLQSVSFSTGGELGTISLILDTSL